MVYDRKRCLKVGEGSNSPLLASKAILPHARKVANP